MSNRSNIVNWIISKIKEVNGNQSSYDQNYTYNFDLSNSCFRGIKFLEEINAFPSIYVMLGKEERRYDSGGFVSCTMPILIKGYCRNNADPIFTCDRLKDDIVHIIYNISPRADYGVKDIIVNFISKDEGLLAPFGIVEIGLTVYYEFHY